MLASALSLSFALLAHPAPARELRAGPAAEGRGGGARSSRRSEAREVWARSASHFGGEELERLEVSASGRTAAVSVRADRSVHLALFETRTGQLAGKIPLRDRDAEARATDWIWGGEALFIGWSDGTVSAHDSNGKARFRRKAHRSDSVYLTATDDGRALSMGGEGTVVVWRAIGLTSSHRVR